MRTTPLLDLDSLNEPEKPRDAKQEIEEIKNGLPKVIEYWNMVKREMDQLLTEANVT